MSRDKENRLFAIKKLSGAEPGYILCPVYYEAGLYICKLNCRRTFHNGIVEKHGHGLVLSTQELQGSTWES